MSNVVSQNRRPSFPPWIILPLLQIIVLVFIARPAGMDEWLVMLSFLLTTFFSSWRLFADPHAYSLNKIWWIFGAIFLGFIPSVQAALHHNPWHQGDISQQTMLHANLLILGCFILYSLLHFWLTKKNLNIQKGSVIIVPQYVARFKIMAPILMTVCFATLLFLYGWKGLFLRGYLDAVTVTYNPTFQLLFDKGIRGITLYLSLAAIVLYRQKKTGFLLTVILLGMAFLANFPLAIPRYLGFAIYVSWLLAAQWKWVVRGRLFVISILAILLLASPLVSVTRYAGTDMYKRVQNPLTLFQNAYLTSDFDTYSSLCRTITYVDANGATQGKQLTGVFLFFVPRKVWPEKPIGSGAHLFTKLGYDFKNVSCTYLAEGYINFGLIGSILFTLIMATIISLYDIAFWRNQGDERFSYSYLFYFIFLGMLMFILRGDLLSSFAYTSGLFISGWVLHRILSGRMRRL